MQKIGVSITACDTLTRTSEPLILIWLKDHAMDIFQLHRISQHLKYLVPNDNSVV